MPCYKLHYFNAVGLAEPIRWMFEHSGTPYEDIRQKLDFKVPGDFSTIDRGNWDEVKCNFPCEQLPCLEIDGVKLGQSPAIYQYVGDVTGLCGKTPIQKALCVEIHGCMVDIFDKVRAIMGTPDGEAKEKLICEARDKMKCCMKRIGEIKECCKGAFLTGDSPTWIDFCFANGIQLIANRMPGASIEKMRERIPKLVEVKDKVEALPKVAAWIEKRPKTAL